MAQVTRYLSIELTYSSRRLSHLIPILLSDRRMLQHLTTLAPILRLFTTHSFRLQKRQPSLPLLKSHQREGNHDRNPVEVISQHAPVRRTVRPAKDRIENAPSAASIELRVAAIDMPDALPNVVRTGTRADFRGVAADESVPGVILEVPDGFAEEACGDEVEEARADCEEDLEPGGVAAAIKIISLPYFVFARIEACLPVDYVAHQGASAQPADDSQREARRWQTQADTANEHHSLQPFPQHRNERQEKHGVLLTPLLELTPRTPLHIAVLLLKRLSEFDSPLVLQLGDAKQSGTHERDDERGNETKDAFPDVFGAGEVVFAEAVEGADHAAANDLRSVSK